MKKIIVLTGEINQDEILTLNKDTNIEHLIKAHKLQEKNSCSETLIKELTEVIGKKRESIKNNLYEIAAYYRDLEWSLVCNHLNIDFQSSYKTSKLINDTLVYLMVMTK